MRSTWIARHGRLRRRRLELLGAALGVGLVSVPSAVAHRGAESMLAACEGARCAAAPHRALFPSQSPLDASLAAQAYDREYSDPVRARAMNDQIPLSKAPVEAAAAFSLLAKDGSGKRALECLTMAIYYEAAYESDQGQRAVAQVVLNRLRHPVFPKSVCGVVFEGASLRVCQFSFTCDGSLNRAPDAAWDRARKVAAAALAGKVEPAVGQATHYHADYVAPFWAPRLAKITQIGTHIFYRWPGEAGLRTAFNGRYAGAEPDIHALEVVAPVEVAEPPPADPYPVERRTDNDLGGRVILTGAWTPTVPLPASTAGAFATVLAGQGSEQPTAPPRG